MKRTRLILAVITSFIDEALIVFIILIILPMLGVVIPIYGLILICIGFGIFAVGSFIIGTHVLNKKPLAGLTDMLDMRGKVLKRLDPEGFVKIQGEIWVARTENGPIDIDKEIVVVRQNRMKLIVREIDS